jgi:hypothetical protein
MLDLKRIAQDKCIRFVIKDAVEDKVLHGESVTSLFFN